MFTDFGRDSRSASTVDERVQPFGEITEPAPLGGAASRQIFPRRSLSNGASAMKFNPVTLSETDRIRVGSAKVWRRPWTVRM